MNTSLLHSTLQWKENKNVWVQWSCFKFFSLKCNKRLIRWAAHSINVWKSLMRRSHPYMRASGCSFLACMIMTHGQLGKFGPREPLSRRFPSSNKPDANEMEPTAHQVLNSEWFIWILSAETGKHLKLAGLWISGPKLFPFLSSYDNVLLHIFDDSRVTFKTNNK